MPQEKVPPFPETATEDLIDDIRSSLIGEGAVLDGPFGPRRMVYADFAASGRALSFVEEYIRNDVLPFYANTHTEASGTGRRTTRLREEARDAIGAAVGAGLEDVVLFCGSGSTAAIDKLIAVLNLRIPRELDARYDLSGHVPLQARPVVFIGPYEHHSNELAWRESLATVVVIPEDAAGRIDALALERALIEHAARPLKLASFSAASNVTGLLSDVRGLTALLHRHGALAFWDYAAAAPYVRVEMNPRQANLSPALTALDAVFISPHKFAGGPSTPGLLIAKRRLFQNSVPTVPGGGTIAYVNADVQRYTPDIASREEAGTPAIVEAIRAALVFELKTAVGEDTILRREESFVRRALSSLGSRPEIVVLGNVDAPRVPIVSFLIRHGDGFLHHHFVVRLLNDLFGIQARSGCSCAGPYGHALLGVEPEASRGFDE
ncbi:MAG: aminotransferase class V-fold PLP-dependent enzyme, partial [Myxococcales bacterium]